MSYIPLIPKELLPLTEKQRFLVWLRSMPITLHTRLHIYFNWLDLHELSYTADEIDSLKPEPVKIVEQPPEKYPHLIREDAELWNDYQILYEPKHSSFMYDVAVGEGRDPGATFPDNIRKMALQLSKRRLDVVGILSNGLEIFELTQSAGLKAAGQAVVYPHLLRVTWQFTLPIKTTIICRVCQDDIKQVLDQFQIEIIVVPTIPRA